MIYYAIIILIVVVFLSITFPVLFNHRFQTNLTYLESIKVSPGYFKKYSGIWFSIRSDESNVTRYLYDADGEPILILAKTKQIIQKAIDLQELKIELQKIHDRSCLIWSNLQGRP